MKIIVIAMLAASLIIAADKESERDADREMKLSKKLMRQQKAMGAKQDAATKTAVELQQLQKGMDARCIAKGQRMGRQGALAVCFTPQPSPPPITNH